MRKPLVKRNEANQLLASNKTKSFSTLVHQTNCVYENKGIKKYRVSIFTTNGWKAYGYFNCLGNAKYVANIAILVEESAVNYALNDVEEKDREELIRWKKIPENKEKESIARARLEEHKNATKLEEQRKLEEKSRFKSIRSLRNDKEQEYLEGLSYIELRKLTQRPKLSGRESRAIHAEIERRKKCGTLG